MGKVERPVDIYVWLHSLKGHCLLDFLFLQEKVTTAVNQFVRATEMVNSLGLFSTNEELAEVPTSELR